LTGREGEEGETVPRMAQTPYGYFCLVTDQRPEKGEEWEGEKKGKKGRRRERGKGGRWEQVGMDSFYLVFKLWRVSLLRDGNVKEEKKREGRKGLHRGRGGRKRKKATERSFSQF